MKKLLEQNNVGEYTTPVVIIASLDKEDIILTSWGLPEIPSNGASVTDATDSVGVASNY